MLIIPLYHQVKSVLETITIEPVVLLFCIISSLSKISSEVAIMIIITITTIVVIMITITITIITIVVIMIITIMITITINIPQASQVTRI